jgi:hypothetical protein
MLEYHVMIPTETEQRGLQEYLKKNGVEDKVIVLAYIACNRDQAWTDDGAHLG